jgi:aspartyl-tRNA(Asn)/glutamyl-tRNA(Gln) amidotransferase subunit C
MEAIVGYMDILNQIDTSGVEPLYSPLSNPAPPRPDVAVKTRSAEEILANAPKRQGRFFAVPPVL